MIKSNNFYVHQLRQLHEMCHSLNGVYNCDALRKAYLAAFNACSDQLIEQGMTAEQLHNNLQSDEDRIEMVDNRLEEMGFAFHRGPGYNGW